MRLEWLLPALALVSISGACASAPPEALGTFGELHCSSRPASICPGDACPTIDGILGDPGACGSDSEYAECDGWTIIHVGDVTNTNTMVFDNYYFEDGVFYAWTEYRASETCRVGPSTFEDMACPGRGTPIPACQ